MEYLEGMTLKHRIGGKPLEVDNRAKIVSDGYEATILRKCVLAWIVTHIRLDLTSRRFR
jgi:hypothetical protein